MDNSSSQPKSLRYFLLAAVVIALTALGAIRLLMLFAPEKTADPATLTGSYISGKGGYTIGLPPQWVVAPVEDTGQLASEAEAVVAGPSQTVVDDAAASFDSLNLAIGEPVLIAISIDGSTAPLPVLSPGLVFELFKSEMPVKDEFHFGLTRDLKVGDTSAVFADFDGASRDGQVHFAGRMVTLVWGQQVGLFIGAAPADQWPAFRPTFNAMIQSLSMYPPTR
jgi:hypothetical protein